jgi:hypothetical protein
MSNFISESSIVTRVPSDDLVSDLIGICNASSIHINVSLWLTFPDAELLTTMRYLFALRPETDSVPNF